ncbi:MAG: MFS transporter [Actinomycetota bacterium]|nr:MFS transporter [Actinomycetota bacterium]
MTDERLGRRTYLGYALGSVGTAGFATVPGLLLAYYLTNSLGVAAALAAVVVLVPKLWDVAFLPIVGTLSDRSAQRLRSRRPFLLAGGLALPVVFVLMFATPTSLGEWAAAAWVLVFFLLAASAFALFQVPYIAMPAEITEDAEERTTMMSWRVAFLALGILLFGVGAPALRDAGNGGAGGYLIMSVGVAALIALGMLGCWWALRRTRPVPCDTSGHGGHSLREQFAVAWRTRSFRILLGAFVIQALATGAMLAAAQYFATYVLGQEGLSDVLFAALIVPALIVMPGWAWVGHRWGKRTGYTAASLAFLAGALALLTARALPNGGILAIVGLCGIGYAGMQMFPLAMLPDAIAADALASGRQRAGAFTGVWTAGETIGFAVGPALVLLMLALTGFVSSTGEPAAQPELAETGVLLAFTVLPAALVALSLPLIRSYRLEPVAVAASSEGVP